MATYQYRCVEDGTFDIRQPMGTAPPRWPCPECGRDGARVFLAPMLSLAPRELVAAIDRTERTRDEPEVVSDLPRRAAPRRPTAPANPALQRLPRP